MLRPGIRKILLLVGISGLFSDPSLGQVATERNSKNFKNDRSRCNISICNLIPRSFLTKIPVQTAKFFSNGAKYIFSLLLQFENILNLTVGEKGETVISLSPKSFCFTNSHPHPRARRAECMVLFVAELHKNVSSTNSEDSKWPQKFILLLSRAVTLILSRQPVVTSLRSKEIILRNFCQNCSHFKF